MSISFDPRAPNVHAPHVPMPLSGPTSTGISSAPTVLESRLSARGLEGGFCAWLTEWIQKICALFRPAPAVAPIPVDLLEQRTAKGIEMLNRQFQRPEIVRADGQRAAIVVIMKYDCGSIETVVCCCRASAQRNERGAIEGQLRRLLSGAAHRSDDQGKFSIETLVFTIRDHYHFNYFLLDSAVNFSSGEETGGEEESNAGLHNRESVDLLQRSITDQAEIARVIRFLANIAHDV